MKEASPVKFYFAKYFFLAFGVLQLLISGLLFIRQGHLPKGQFAAFVFFTLGLVFVSVFLLISTKIKRVAVGKKKLAIIDSYRTECYQWPDIKSIQFVPYFNLYRMKVRGRKGKIYFLPNQSTEAIYGLFPSGGFIDQKQNK